MWALTADADFLAQRGEGQVEQVFARAVNIALPAHQQLLTLLCEEYDNAPNSCRLALTHFDGLFRHGDKVQFDDHGITVGQHIHIDKRRCQRWLSPVLQLTTENFHFIAWQQWHDIIHQHLGENETLFNYCGDNPFYQALNKELQIKRRRVIQALSDKQNIASTVANMMGLGIGLTPSADDYLTGLALVLFISGHPAEKYKGEFYRGLQCGRNNTTLLSAITLEAALQQRCRENIHHFIYDIIYSVPGNSTQAIEKIKHIGSSSGCDMLYGMADGCALSQTYGGNYVS